MAAGHAPALVPVRRQHGALARVPAIALPGDQGKRLGGGQDCFLPAIIHRSPHTTLISEKQNLLSENPSGMFVFAEKRGF